MIWKLLGKAAGVCNDNAKFSGFILPKKFRLKFGLFSKSWIYDAKCENEGTWKWHENFFQIQQNLGPLGWNECYCFMEHIYHKEVGDAELG